MLIFFKYKFFIDVDLFKVIYVCLYVKYLFKFIIYLFIVIFWILWIVYVYVNCNGYCFFILFLIGIFLYEGCNLIYFFLLICFCSWVFLLIFLLLKWRNIIFGSEEFDLELICMIVFMILFISLLRIFLFLINIIFVFIVNKIEDGRYILIFVKW